MKDPALIRKFTPKAFNHKNLNTDINNKWKVNVSVARMNDAHILGYECRCEACSWCIDIHRAVRLDPGGTFEWRAKRDCLIVSGDSDECVTCVKYITFHVFFHFFYQWSRMNKHHIFQLKGSK